MRCLNNAAPTKYYYTRDHLGSVYEMTNTSAAVQAAYSYVAYGERTKRWGAQDTENAYTGHWDVKPASFAKQAAPGLSLTWFRAYDPKRGVWLNRDPSEEHGGINLYRMVENAPIMKIDLDGLESLSVGVCEIAIYAGHLSQATNVDVVPGTAGGSRSMCWKFAFIGCFPDNINGKIEDENRLDGAPMQHSRMFAKTMGGAIGDAHRAREAPFSDDVFDNMWKNSIPEAIKALQDQPCCCRSVKLRIIVKNDDVLAHSQFPSGTHNFNRKY